MSAGGGRGSGSMNHLSGEMIRKLREQQKVRAAATAAAAVAVAVANASASSHQGGRLPGHRRREDSGKSLPPSSSSSTTTPSTAPPSRTVTTATQPPPLMSARDNLSSDLFEARLNGQLIPAFNIGGESRLCLPLILRQILGPFHWDQVPIQ